MENEEILKGETKIPIVFTGELVGGKGSDFPPIQFYLFNNKEEDYNNWKAVWTQELEINTQDENYEFEVKENLDLSPGLYYFLFEDVDENEFLKIGKFSVVE